MDIYVATKRVRFDTDEIIGIFSTRDFAEDAIVKFILDIKNKRSCPLEELFFTMAASWEIDAWTVDDSDNARKENYGLTEHFIKELLEKMEAA